MKILICENKKEFKFKLTAIYLFLQHSSFLGVLLLCRKEGSTRNWQSFGFSFRPKNDYLALKTVESSSAT
jgi:hypothetical protein